MSPFSRWFAAPRRSAAGPVPVDSVRVLRHRVHLARDGTVRAMLGAEIAVGTALAPQRFPGVTEEQWRAGVWLPPSAL